MKDKLMNDKKVRTAVIYGGLVLVGGVLGLALSNAKQIPTLKDGKQIIASIDGKDFTADELYSDLKGKMGNQSLLMLIDQFISEKEATEEQNKKAKESAEAYLEQIKGQYEQAGQDFAAALTQAGYKDEAAFVEDVKKDELTTLIANAYIRENQFSDKDIKDYYNNNIEGSMDARYILVKPEVTEDMTQDEITKAEEAALKEANDIIAQLKKDGDFAELAKKHSDDASSASDGGMFKGFKKDEVVSEFWDAAVNLKDGKYTTEPVKSSYGYFVILRIKQNEKETLKEAKDEILDALLEKYTTENTNATEKAWIEIRKNYGLDIIDSDIKKIYEDTVKNNK